MLHSPRSDKQKNLRETEQQQQQKNLFSSLCVKNYNVRHTYVLIKNQNLYSSIDFLSVLLFTLSPDSPPFLSQTSNLHLTTLILRFVAQILNDILLLSFRVLYGNEFSPLFNKIEKKKNLPFLPVATYLLPCNLIRSATFTRSLTEILDFKFTFCDVDKKGVEEWARIGIGDAWVFYLVVFFFPTASMSKLLFIIILFIHSGFRSFRCSTKMQILK